MDYWFPMIVVVGSKTAMAPSGVAQGRRRGSKRGVQSEKVKSPEIVEATYDSDSYENHVIDLRGLKRTFTCAQIPRDLYVF